MEKEMSVCDRVQKAGGKRLFGWLESFEDTQLRCDLAEHIARCSRCSQVLRAALALGEKPLNSDDEDTVFGYITRPLEAWIRTIAQPVPVYGAGKPGTEPARMWCLEVGTKENMHLASIKLISASADAVLVSAQSEHPELEFAIRAFNGSEALFETSVKGDGLPSVVRIESEIDENTDIEVIECR